MTHNLLPEVAIWTQFVFVAVFVVVLSVRPFVVRLFAVLFVAKLSRDSLTFRLRLRLDYSSLLDVTSHRRNVATVRAVPVTLWNLDDIKHWNLTTSHVVY